VSDSSPSSCLCSCDLTAQVRCDRAVESKPPATPTGGLTETELVYKIMVVGNAACGKTSIIKRFVDNVFSETYKSTVGADFSRKIIQWDELTTVSSAHRFSRLLSSGLGAFQKAVAREGQEQCGSNAACDLRLSEYAGRTTVQIRLQLWDIAGQDRFAAVTRAFYKNAVGAVVVW
jgi:small GTP-binding protein